MRNDTPQPIRCAVCNRTGRVGHFTSASFDGMNWIEGGDGQTYVVCNDHKDSVSVTMEDGLHGHPFVRSAPVFYAESTLCDLERRIASLEGAP